MFDRASKTIFILLTSAALAACAHETPSTPVISSAHYVLQSQQGAEAVTTPGFVSRYQREIIVAGGMDTPSSPCAQNFDNIMDHLEAAMAPQIAENNRIASNQMTDPSYRF